MLKNKDGHGARVAIRLTAEYVCGGKWGQISTISLRPFSSMDKICTNGRFTEETGSLLSPFWPNNYFNSESCFYDVMSGILCFFNINVMLLIKLCLPLQGPRRQKGFFNLSWFQPQHQLPKVKPFSRQKIDPCLYSGRTNVENMAETEHTWRFWYKICC